MQNSYGLFCSQLEDAISAYPNLKLQVDKHGLHFLKGILDIPNDEGQIISSFLIEIHFKTGFPYRFPVLFETGGDIPNEADWHKYSNGSCCITVAADEIVKCKNGITLKDFIKRFAVSYFANYLYRKEEGKYLNDEYAHGGYGIFQFYNDLFKTGTFTDWMRWLDNAFKNSEPTIPRNDLCFCGSNKK